MKLENYNPELSVSPDAVETAAMARNVMHINAAPAIVKRAVGIVHVRGETTVFCEQETASDKWLTKYIAEKLAKDMRR